MSLHLVLHTACKISGQLNFIQYLGSLGELTLGDWLYLQENAKSLKLEKRF